MTRVTAVLTKTDYLAYIRCPLAFWLAKYRSEMAAPPDPATQRRLRMGIEVDRLARDLFPEGRLIPYRPHPEEMALLTAQAIEASSSDPREATTLFQATFVADDLLVKTDILLRDGDGWRLIEVKSSTSVKEEHLADVAFQYYVLRQAGLNVTRATVMFINNRCRYPDLSGLFATEDVTAAVLDSFSVIAGDVAEMRRLAGLAGAPNVPIGRHCKGCAFHQRCWQGIDGLTIYQIPRLDAQTEAQLASAGALYLHQVPDDLPLTAKQRAFVRFHARKEIAIDAGAIRKELATLQFPLTFFDFETIDHTVPIYDGCVPYQQVPFQYSCHVLHRDGTLVHREYLHMTGEDPRPALLEAMLEAIQGNGQVVAYNAPFEKGVLHELAEAFPSQAHRLQEIIDRLWDQLLIFRKYYRHHGFRNSNSLKSVLPVVVPQLSYEALAVQDGAQAQVVWEELIAADDDATREQLAADLRTYCRLDTLAMVEIHRVLANL